MAGYSGYIGPFRRKEKHVLSCACVNVSINRSVLALNREPLLDKKMRKLDMDMKAEYYKMTKEIMGGRGKRGDTV